MTNQSATAPAPVNIHSVLVIDDHPLFCEALAMTLQDVLELKRIETANSLASGMDSLKSGFRADAIVLDLNLPDVSGVEGLLRLRAQMPKIPIVVVSALGDSRVISAVIAAGAAGFIRKDAPRDDLAAAFRKIWAGETYLPDDYSRAADNPGEVEKMERTVEKLASLTPQQVTILKLICEGKLNKQIAYELSIAETTVKAHITAILRKLGVHSRTQAALLAKEADFSALLR